RHRSRPRQPYRAPRPIAYGRSALIPPAEIIFVVRSVARAPTQDKPAALPPRRIWSKTPSRGAEPRRRRANCALFFYAHFLLPLPNGGRVGGGGSADELEGV